jgi:hypothetical protein
MEKKTMDQDELIKLRRREKELLKRIERMKKIMNETKEMDTLVFQMQLLKKAKEELGMIQQKLTN